MKIDHFLFTAFIIVLVQGCLVFPKRQMSSTTVIQNAIMDFSKTRRFHKKDSVFQVTFNPEVYKRVVKKDSAGGIETIKGEKYQGMQAVDIFPNFKKVLLSANVKVGLKSTIVPSRFMEINQKLYLWWDLDYPLTQETLDVLEKYHVFQDDEGGIITFPEDANYHSKRGVYYYYCSSNPHQYKRIFTNEWKRHKIPRLKCKL